MASVLAFLALFFLLVIQTTVFQIPPLTTIHPDMVVVLLMYISMILGARQAVFYGLAIGLVEDIIYGRFIGLYAFSFALIGYFAGLVFNLFFHKSLLLILVTVLASTCVFELITVSISGLYEISDFALVTVVDYTIRTMIFNGIFTLLIYAPAVKWLEKAANRRRRGRLSDPDLNG
ncbi:rod shape-determining protein MreD [Fodinisporobacter ferrooxydans]|uniref:Rod shape-determining protein MreD n=1 Tax=Fodinisporobacter ferrooxydans TaxID=2901836 RepID=A0ABY4CI68_9BACL|nr:rod shape-determining protein MreD [Alicyclobacillaceae bacterium MYW30-H2]